MSKRKKEKKGRIYRFIGTIFIIASIMLFGIVLYVDILPLKYLAIVGGVLLFLNLIIDFFLFRRKVKKKHKKFFSIIALLLSALFAVASFFIIKTFGVLEEMTENYKTYTYDVLVKKDSLYQDIKDLEGKTLGYYNDNNPATSKAITKLKDKVKTDNDSYGNLETLGKELLTSETESILVEESQKIKLDNAGASTENAQIAGFKDKTRVLYTFKVRIKEKGDGVNVTKDVFNIYISGMDEYGEVAEVSRSDVNMIITVNPKTKQILLTNIPRDYYVQLHDTTGYKDKLTHAGIYGIDTSKGTLEDLLGIKINYHVKVNFSSLENIINALGGVDVYSEYDFQSWNGYNFTKGYNRVDGKAGLAFVRERKTFNEGDNQRGKNQQAMIEAIFRKCTSSSIIPRYNTLLNSLEDSLLTNMPMKNIKKLAKFQIKTNAKWIITSNSLTGTGSYEPTYTYPYQDLYVTVPDEESVKLSKEMISKVTSGEILQSSYNGDSSNSHAVTKSNVSRSVTKSTTTKKKQEVKQETKQEEPVQDTTEQNAVEPQTTEPDVTTGEEGTPTGGTNPQEGTTEGGKTPSAPVEGTDSTTQDGQ